MLRRVARVLRIGLVVLGISVLVWVPLSFRYVAHINWRGSVVLSEAGALHVWQIWDIEDLKGLFATDFRAYFGKRAFLLGIDQSSVKDALVPSVTDRIVGFRDTLVTIPLWLPAFLCLAWPVTSLLLARRRRKGRGFAVEAGGGGPAPGIDPPPRRPDNIPPP